MTIRNELLIKVLEAYGGVGSIEARNIILQGILSELGGEEIPWATRNELLFRICTQLGGSPSITASRNKLLRCIVVASGGEITNPNNRNSLINDWLSSITPDLSLYVNPEFVGAAAPWTVPNNHTDFGLNANNEMLVQDLGNGFNQLTINPNVVSGRAVFIYPLGVNNPTLTAGSFYRISFEARRVGGFNAGASILSANGLTNITVINSDTTIPDSSPKRVFIEFSVNDASYAASFRIGNGVTSETNISFTIKYPILEEIGAPISGTYSVDYSDDYE